MANPSFAAFLIPNPGLEMMKTGLAARAEERKERRRINNDINAQGEKRLVEDPAGSGNWKVVTYTKGGLDYDGLYNSPRVIDERSASPEELQIIKSNQMQSKYQSAKLADYLNTGKSAEALQAIIDDPDASQEDKDSATRQLGEINNQLKLLGIKHANELEEIGARVQGAKDVANIRGATAQSVADTTTQGRANVATIIADSKTGNKVPTEKEKREAAVAKVVAAGRTAISQGMTPADAAAKAKAAGYPEAAIQLVNNKQDQLSTPPAQDNSSLVNWILGTQGN